MADILSEIRSLDGEFDEVEIDAQERRISVTTGDIVLEDTALGAFSIQLHFDRLATRRDASAFMIVALEANPACSDSSCTHPHVQDKCLCAGDATTPISHALADGRIGDAFQLINRVLHTYNGASAYVALSDWDGHECPDCGRTTSSEGLYYCSHCDRDYCDECMRSCDHCEESVCLGCATRNDDGERLCPKCIELDKQEEEAEVEATASDDSDFDPDEGEPQPSTETIHECSHSNSPDAPPDRAELPGGARPRISQRRVRRFSTAGGMSSNRR